MAGQTGSGSRRPIQQSDYSCTAGDRRCDGPWPLTSASSCTRGERIACIARARRDPDEPCDQHGAQCATVLALVNTLPRAYVGLRGLVIGWVAGRPHFTTVMVMGLLALGGALAWRGVMSVSWAPRRPAPSYAVLDRQPCQH